MILDSFMTILGVAIALGCDTFSVGLALGTRRLNTRAAFRLWFHFGLFQFLMPIIGFLVGQSFLRYIREVDHWIAFGVLAFVALRMLVQSLSGAVDEKRVSIDPTRGWSLIGLSIATSLDAMGVGFSLGILGGQVLYPALCIGIVAALMTFSGIKLGSQLSARFGKRVETVGALVLLLIAVRLLEV